MVAAEVPQVTLLELAESNDGYGSQKSQLGSFTRHLRQELGVKIANADAVEAIQDAPELVVVANPKQKLTVTQFDHLKGLMSRGSSLLVLLNEQGEKGAKSNINYFLEEFGISVNADNVIRTSFVQRYYHPKEAVIATPGIVSPDFCPPCTFVYPYGASLNVQSPAVPLLTSSNVCYPVNRPICAFYPGDGKSGGGSLVVLGSIDMFSEEYLQKESNARIGEALVKLLLTRKSLHGRLEMHDNAEVPEYVSVPDTTALSDRLKSTLQEGDNDVGQDDIQSMFYDSNLYKLDNLLFAEISQVYEKLHIPINQLSLIKPNFETPLPALKPATFPPVFREPIGPEVELFDLDEALSSQRVRLAQITNRCRPDEIADLEYMLTMSGEALGISKDVKNAEPINILRHIFNRIRDYKMESQD